MSEAIVHDAFHQGSFGAAPSFFNLGLQVGKLTGDGANPYYAKASAGASMPADVWFGGDFRFGDLSGFTDPYYFADMFYLWADFPTPPNFSVYEGVYAFIDSGVTGDASHVYLSTVYTSDYVHGFTVASNTWYSVDVHVTQLTFPDIQVEVYVNNTLYYDATNSLSGVGSDYPTTTPEIWVSSQYFADAIDFFFDEVRVGTTGIGSSDLFFFDAEDGNLVPPFDSAGGGMSVVAPP